MKSASRTAASEDRTPVPTGESPTASLHRIHQLTSLWTIAGRRLDRLRAGPAGIVGILLGLLAGGFFAVSPSVAGLVAFVVVLAVATVLAALAEPVAEEPVAAAPREPEAGKDWIHPVDGSVMVYVPPGVYRLGADEATATFLRKQGASQEWVERSRPAHAVRLSGFWIARVPVTNARYRRFLEARPDQQQPSHWQDDRFNHDDQPVVGVSWHDAQAYCAWAGLELPTEAQWEAAARGTDQRQYPWGDESPTDEHACFGSSKTESVGGHPRGQGPFGTLDQAGNVWEWCLDAWDPKAYETRDGEVDPLIEGDESAVRVLRGGSWSNPAGDLVSANRFRSRSSFRDQGIGFRCVSSVPAEP